MNLYVGNIPYDMDEDLLTELFQMYGEVKSARVIMDRETGRSRGFGFVEMKDGDAARHAIEDLSNSTVNDRELVINEARPKVARY